MSDKEITKRAIRNILDTAIGTNAEQIANVRLFKEGLKSCPDEWKIQANNLYEILRFNTEMRDNYITFLKDLKKELEYFDDTDKLYNLALDIGNSLMELAKSDYRHIDEFDRFTKSTLDI